MNNRIAILKAMDTIMRNAEDEQVTKIWLTTCFPDEAMDTIMRNAEDVYEFIADKDELYFGVADAFRVLISAYSHRIFGRTTK